MVFSSCNTFYLLRSRPPVGVTFRARTNQVSPLVMGIFWIILVWFSFSVGSSSPFRIFHLVSEAAPDTRDKAGRRFRLLTEILLSVLLGTARLKPFLPPTSSPRPTPHGGGRHVLDTKYLDNRNVPVSYKPEMAVLSRRTKIISLSFHFRLPY